MERTERSGAGPRVKGLAFQTLLRCAEELLGADACKEALDRAPAEVREALAYKRVVAAGWYEIAWYRALLGALVGGGETRREIAMNLGAMSVRSDLSGVYRLLTKVLSPETLFSGAARLFGNYYDTGTVQVIAARPGHAEATWEGCAGFDRNMWDEVRGSCRAILELGGASHVRLHTMAGGGDGDPFLHARGYWTTESTAEPA